MEVGTGKPDQDILLDEAIDLVIRLQNDPDNSVAIEMIHAWRARSEMHEKIWLRVEKIHGASGKILNFQRRVERREGLTRRHFLLGAFIAAGGGATLYSFVPELLLNQRADYRTAKGEIRKIELEDRSLITLGPDSAIAIDYDNKQRAIQLLAGMAYFEVAKERNRPFKVYAASAQVTALGTAFEVSNDAGFMTVGVDHGIVEMQSSISNANIREILHQGQWLVFDPSQLSIERSDRESGQVASWRDHFLVAEKETLASLVARIGRWHQGRIVVVDPYIGEKRISGIFDLQNPLGALEAVVKPAGGKVYQLTSALTIISPI